ncbi:MAG: stage V sporulation protein AB [Schaedlerella sp.]|nr:stage V sporulation protein AB [Schaedlerella sp.]
MFVQQAILGLIGLSAGTIVSAGLFALIVELGILIDFADRTHTADKILLYENCTMLGGVTGNLIVLFPIKIIGLKFLLPVFGLLSGIFVGGWSMALAEMLNVFPVFIRRLKIVRYITVFVISIALGRSLGALIFLVNGW